MTTGMRKRWRSATRFRPGFLSLVTAGFLLVPPAAAQELTGTLVVIATDTQGGVLVGAVVRVCFRRR